MRGQNFRNNQMILDVYVMEVDADIEMDNLDESFLNEWMAIAYKAPALFIRKLYYEIFKISRTEDMKCTRMKDLMKSFLFP
jgi:hypothetical protein